MSKNTIDTGVKNEFYIKILKRQLLLYGTIIFMKYNSYQHVGHKTFIINLLKNATPTIFIFFIWIVFIILKIIGAESLFTSLNTPDIIPLINLALNWGLIGGFVFMVLSFLLALFVTSLDYLTFYFMLDEHGLCMKQGILNKQEISIPYRQIQDINIERPLLYQIFGVCRLNIITTGQDNDHDDDPTEANFPIVDKDLAYDLRGQLLEHSNIQLVSNPVDHPNAPLNDI